MADLLCSVWFSLDSVLSWGPYLYSMVSRGASPLRPPLSAAQQTSPGSVLRKDKARWVCLWGRHCSLGTSGPYQIGDLKL